MTEQYFVPHFKIIVKEDFNYDPAVALFLFLIKALNEYAFKKFFPTLSPAVYRQEAGPGRIP